MSINSIDREKLKILLEVVLEPLTNADPAALAKYVVALIKGKVQLTELRGSLVHNLNVFLQDKTNTFVDYVLKLLESQVYELPQWGILPFKGDQTLLHPGNHASGSSFNVEPSSSREVSRMVATPMDSRSTVRAQRINPTKPPNSVNIPSTFSCMPVICEGLQSTSAQSVVPTMFGSCHSHLVTDTRTHHGSVKEWDRKEVQSWKMKSGLYQQCRNQKEKFYSQKRFHEVSSRSLVSEHYPCNSKSKLVRTSLESGFFPDVDSQSGLLPNEVSLVGEIGCRQDTENILHEVTSVQRTVPRERYSEVASIEMHPKQKCVDFERKGYCMLGDMCGYDHGNNPVVVGESSLLPYNVCSNKGTQDDSWCDFYKSECKKTDSGSTHYNFGARGSSTQLAKPNILPKIIYSSENCKKNCVLQIKNIPHGLNSINHISNHFSKFGKIIDIKVCFQDDPRSATIKFSSWFEANTAYKSSEPIFNNRFVKIFWCNSNYPRESTSQVTYTNNSSQTSDSCSPQLPVPHESSSTHGRKYNTLKHPSPSVPASSFQGCSSAKRVKIIKDTSFKVVYIPTPLNKLQVKRGNSKWVSSKGDSHLHWEKKRKEALKLMTYMQKRKQNLIVKQLGVQKELVAKLEKFTQPSHEKETVISQIKSCEESILKLRSEVLVLIARSHSLLKSYSEIGRIKDEIQRELLDVELEFFAAENRGGNTAELQHKMEVLGKLVQLVGMCGSEQQNT